MVGPGALLRVERLTKIVKVAQKVVLEANVGDNKTLVNKGKSKPD